jgi:tripartite-type tricarboxylate transporter receptor subunit TctC
MTRRSSTLAFIAGLVASLALSGGAIAADSYPSRAVHLVFGLSAGSSSDTMIRIVAQKLSERWKQPVIVDNRPGAGGNIAAEEVSHAPADGYTLLLSNNSIAIAPSFYKHLNYDPLRDLIPITQVSSVPHILCVNPSMPVKTVQDIVNLAKAKPTQINFSSAGVGQTDHMAMELFAEMTGIRMTHIPYKGGPPALYAVVSGDVSMDFPGLTVAMPLMKSGKIKCLAVSTSTRSPTMPDVPTMQEEGVKGYNHTLWNGVFAPAGTPQAIIDRVAAGFAEVLASPDVKARLATLGAEPIGTSPAQFEKDFHAEVAKWAQLIKATGISGG